MSVWKVNILNFIPESPNKLLHLNKQRGKAKQ